MRHVPLALLLVALMCNVQAASPKVPKDVDQFLDRREACDHFRGEDGYDEERRLEIQRALCETCLGTDAELARLKAKYKKVESVQVRLEVFESHIEPKKKDDQVKLCRALKSPK